MPPGEHLAHLGGRERGGIQGPALGSKAQAPFHLLEIEGLDAQPIAGQQELLALVVVGGEGKHAAEALQEGGPVLGQALHEGFAVAVAAPGLKGQLWPGLEVVVDLPVEHQGEAAAVAGDRLGAGLREIEDGQAGVAEPAVAIRAVPGAFRIRTPVAQAMEGLGPGRLVPAHLPDQTAHGPGPWSRWCQAQAWARITSSSG